MKLLFESWEIYTEIKPLTNIYTIYSVMSMCVWEFSDRQ